MSFFERIKSLFSGPANQEQRGARWQSLLTEVGVAEACCPYCGHEFPKMPQRKRKCPACGDVLYSRKRPLDEAKVLLTEAQARDLEAESELHGIASRGELSESELDGLVLEVGRALGHPATAEDVVVAHRTRLAERYATEWQWGLYRNARFGLAEARMRQGRLEDGLRLYLEVCFLDLNGPSNCGTRDPSVLRDYPPFRVKLAMLAPGVLQRVNTAAESLGLTEKEIGAMFTDVCASIQIEPKLPRSAKAAWRELASSLSDAKGVRKGLDI